MTYFDKEKETNLIRQAEHSLETDNNGKNEKKQETFLPSIKGTA